jgi:hypothetical protein
MNSLVEPTSTFLAQATQRRPTDLGDMIFIVVSVGFFLVVGALLFGLYYRDQMKRQKHTDADREAQRDAFLKREEAQRRDIEQNISLGNESLRKMRLEIELMELQKRRMLGGPPPIVGPDADDESVPPTPTHEDLNRLMAQKMERELKLLDVQVELARRDQAMRSDQLDYHDTMMEKAKLEIESLKLHIKEQRKRLDEGFGG